MAQFTAIATDRTNATQALDDHAPMHNSLGAAVNALKALVPSILDDGADVASADNVGALALSLANKYAAVVPPGTFKTGTVVLGNSDRLVGIGPAALSSKNALNGPLIRIPANSHDIIIDDIELRGNSANQTSGYLIEVGDGCYNITIGPGVVFTDTKTAVFNFLGTHYRNIQIGGNRWVVDALQLGVPFDALFYDAGADGVTVSTSNNTISNLQGLARAEMVGWTVNVTSAGKPDTASTPGRRTYVGTVATVASDGNSITVTSADATNPNPGVSGTGFRASIGRDASVRLKETYKIADLIGASAVSHPGGNAWFAFPMPVYGDATYYGQGPHRTKLRFAPSDSGIQIHQVRNVSIRDMHVQGAGPDGGPDGVSYAGTGIDVKHSQKVWIGPGIEVSYFNNGGISLRADDPFNTALYGTVQDFTKDVFLVGTPYIHDHFTSNGTIAGTFGIALWLFDNCERVHGSVQMQNIGRHGLFIDGGTTAQQAPGQHGNNKDCVFPSVIMKDVCTQYGGTGVGFDGATDCHIGTLVIDGCGNKLLPATGIAFSQDQNGETATNCSVTKASVSKVGGLVASFGSVVGNSIVELTVRDWNLVQNASYDRPIHFGAYPGLNDGVQNAPGSAATVPISDCYKNWIGTLRMEYSTDPTLYNTTINIVTSTGAISAGSMILEDLNANWTRSNVPIGALVSVANAGVGGATHNSTVTDIIDNTHLLIADAAVSTVAGKAVTVTLADPLRFTYCIEIIGGTAGPDGSGQTVSGTLHTRRMRTYDNRVGMIETTFPPSQSYATFGPPHVITATGNMTAGSAQLDDTSAPFDATLTPLGSPITVAGAGAGGAILVSYIRTITSPTRATLGHAAITTTAAGTAAVNVTQDYFAPVGGSESNYVGLKLNRPTAGSVVAMASVEGERYSRFEYTNIGRLLWGPGSLPWDVSLYRNGAGRLTTDHNLQASNGIATRYQNTSTTPFVGGGGVPTDADFNNSLSVTPGMTVPDGTLLVEYTGTVYKLWVRANGVYRSTALA
jgi:hypothetical protein